MAYLAATLVIEFFFSFSRPKVADVSFLYYLAWLIDEHNIKPYLQLYDTSFPGTFIFHVTTGKLFGYGDRAYHYADIFFISLLLAMTWLLLKPLHTRVAAAAVVSFGLYYFVSANTSMHFQRDYIAIIPIVASLLFAQRWRGYEWFCYFAIGFLFSLSASIKPHFAIGLPVVMCYALLTRLPAGKISTVCRWLQMGAYVLAGFVLWMLICAIWLVFHGSLAAFFAMTTHYLPIYMNMDGTQAVIATDSDPWGFLSAILNEAKLRWAVAGVATISALIMLSFQRHMAVLVLTLFSLCAVYILYVFLGGKGWDYHWMPFVYFQIVCSCLLLTPLKTSSRKWAGRVATVLLTCVCAYSLQYFYRIFIYPADAYQKLGHVKNEFRRFPYDEAATQELVTYLKTRTQPGDKIGFRKDGSYGPVFPALLQLGLVPATSFPLQTMLYRATDKPYIQSLRQQLLQESAEPARFLLDDGQFSPEGKDSFPEYEKFIRKNYEFSYDNASTHGIPYYFAVYERKIK